MTGNLDDLIAESQAIRDELLRTVGKIDAFSEALTAEAIRLRNEVSSARDSEAATQDPDASSPTAQGKHRGSEGGNPQTWERA